jgi:hypothetical protein
MQPLRGFHQKGEGTEYPTWVLVRPGRIVFVPTMLTNITYSQSFYLFILIINFFINLSCHPSLFPSSLFPHHSSTRPPRWAKKTKLTDGIIRSAIL